MSDHFWLSRPVAKWFNWLSVVRPVLPVAVFQLVIEIVIRTSFFYRVDDIDYGMAKGQFETNTFDFMEQKPLQFWSELHQNITRK